MEKRGQITTFIIVGMILLISISFLVYSYQLYEDSKAERDLSQSFVTRAISDYVESCMDASLERGMLILSAQGGEIFLSTESFVETEDSGYFTNETFYFDELPVRIKYGYYYGNNLVPSLSYMENELELFMESSIGECLNGFALYDGAVSSDDVPDVELLINGNLIRAKMEYSVQIDLVDVVYKITNFEITKENKLDDMIDVTNFIVNEQIREPQKYLLDFDLSGLFVSSYPGYANDSVVMYIIEDKENSLEGTNHKFVTASLFETYSYPEFDNIDSNYYASPQEIISVYLGEDKYTLFGEDEFAYVDSENNFKFLSNISGIYEYQIQSSNDYGSKIKPVMVIVE